MPLFRKKPVVIEAKQIPGEVNDELHVICRWARASLETTNMSDPRVHIRTLEGTMVGDPGDWIIKGVNGEFYPCKPDIFEKTYEPVEE
jgi:hypothetical protein